MISALDALERLRNGNRRFASGTEEGLAFLDVEVADSASEERHKPSGAGRKVG